MEGVNIFSDFPTRKTQIHSGKFSDEISVDFRCKKVFLVENPTKLGPSENVFPRMSDGQYDGIMLDTIPLRKNEMDFATIFDGIF